VPAESQPAVVTDSTAYLPDEIVAAHDIHRVSLYVTLDGEQRPESEIGEAEYDDFYERLRNSESGATTSQPSVGDFLAVYEPLLAAGREVISIHISSGISGTVESARQARQQLIDSGQDGERITVWDSRSGCGGQALMTLVAVHAAEQGASAAEAMDRVERARDSMKMWFAIETLEYLRRGGRIGAAQALLGSALQIKPILTLEEEIRPIERVRTRRRAFERMVEFARERKRDGAETWVVQHIHDPDSARQLVEEGRQVFGSDPIFVSEIGPVIGAHIGPGLLGFGGIRSEYLS
jgi:DegV family protein with EDD domain